MGVLRSGNRWKILPRGLRVFPCSLNHFSETNLFDQLPTFALESIFEPNMASLGDVTTLKRRAPRFHAERPGRWVEIFYEGSIFAKTDFLETLVFVP